MQPVAEVQTLEAVISDSILGLSYVAVMLTVLGAIALALASVGVYALLAYAVSERLHEIGVRMALGAVRGDVVALVVGRGMALSATGLLAGLVGAVFLARLLSGLLFGVSAGDLTIFGGVSAVLLLVAFLACWIPAERASRVDPMLALRHD
jgi:putative ABC transport system permease protein